MTEINLSIEGVRGEAVERFAVLAGKSMEQLVLSWIDDRVNHATVVAMRAGNSTWEDVAKELGTSITQVRRIYAAGSEFQPIGKDDTRTAEKYLKLLEEIRDLSNEGNLFPVPTESDIDIVEQYMNALPDPDAVVFPVPTQNDLDMIEEYENALPDPDAIVFPVPSEEDIDAVERYSKAVTAGDLSTISARQGHTPSR